MHYMKPILSLRIIPMDNQTKENTERYIQNDKIPCTTT